MEKELRLLNVNKKYKLTNREDFQALYDINVEFDKGELVSIVGESGSGKSTLMNLIGGLDSDFTGDILIGEDNLRTLTDKQLDNYRKNKVGFVFQSFNLISHLSILDNVTLALTLSNVSEKEKIEKATEMLRRVGLEGHLKKKPTQLSGGQKQRVAIARALINDPEIIIADEPTGALDSETSMQILQILKEIADGGKLVLMVTHSEKVASISSRVVTISDGRITSDTINKNYKKDEQELALTPSEIEAENQNSKSNKQNKKRNGKNTQNLSMRSAIRLSFHNMWASKIKNFLMAFGVAIGIGSLILMMCFSSGITDFIDNTMRSYSDPEIVTISKKGNNKDMTSMFSYNSFSPEEIANLTDDINNYLQEQEIDFTVDNSNIEYGVQMMTMMSNAKVIYNPNNLTEFDVNYFDDTSLKNSGLSYDTIIYLYTTPPYYTNTNIVEGTMSTSTNGIMFSKGIRELFDDGKITNSDGTNKKVDICFTYSNPNAPQETTNFVFRQQEVTAIVDTSVMSNFLVMYIDYDYFQSLFKTNSENPSGNALNPNVLYIRTGSEAITNAINTFLKSSESYSGSVEEQLAGMFTNMSSTIGTSLVVISCISLVVSAMMILVVLYMSVSERTKEIGVLKSIGARRKDIKRIFTSESFLIGVLSGLFGIVFNLILTLVVWLVLKNTIGLAPISYRWWYFVVAMLVSIVISMLSGLYPASKAAKLDPVESLRRE
ncbi:MAG: ATP-binding cassette domain-containing protein [Candidatus Caccovivens sp.]